MFGDMYDEQSEREYAWERMNDGDQDFEDVDDDPDLQFADPGGNSALRAATPDNPRIFPCPTCKWPNRLTQRDINHGYQCDSCANAIERGTDINYYEPEDGDEDDSDDVLDESE